ncbi:hypothetical protein [Trichlorobacter sp.]|uniref:hypothetical protein n=1 Tax=Trichlorobacter sp. TaxID=2911007 RepID=UPI002A36D31B|nr:hypothetical protein [Trichlorobacter sp.]MDY0384537.1 hypothetical protein [Trichlorobacter sp.]
MSKKMSKPIQNDNNEFAKYSNDINHVIGLFAYASFVSCMSLNGENYVSTFSKQQYYAWISFAVMLLAVITRGNGIRQIIEKRTKNTSVFKFIIENPIYFSGVALLVMLGFGLVKN